MGKQLKKLTDEARRKKRAKIREKKISHKQKVELGGSIDLPEKGVENV